ncbi:hypothetical protein Q7P35_011331 [Cladosporium inversicolor]
MKPISTATALITLLLLPMSALAVTPCTECFEANNACEAKPDANPETCTSDYEQCSDTAFQTCQIIFDTCILASSTSTGCELDRLACVADCYEEGED